MVLKAYFDEQYVRVFVHANMDSRHNYVVPFRTVKQVLL